MYFEGELPVMTYNGCNNGNNGWNDWSWIIGLALVGGLFGGWGNGGFGFGAGRDAYGVPATQADLSAGFASNSILSNLNDIILQTSQGFAAVQQTLCQGFSGIDRAIADTNANLANAICTLGYQNQTGFNALASQIASCCCDLKTMNLENRYLNAQQTCEIVQAINAGNQRLVDIYTGDKIAALQAENTALRGQISNDKQTATIVSQLRDPGCPVASYLVPNPNCCYNPFGFGYGAGYGFNGGCCGSVQ